MTKSMKIVLFLLFSSLFFTFTSCGLKEKLLGPEDEWQVYSFKYKDVDLNCYFLYSDDDYSMSNVKDDYQTLKAGLTVIVSPNKEKNNTELALEAIGKLFGVAQPEYYFIKTFEKGEDLTLVEESDEESATEAEKKSFKINKTKWSIIYNCLDFQDSQIPEALTNNNYKDVEKEALNDQNIKFSFNWENILADMLKGAIDSLLG